MGESSESSKFKLGSWYRALTTGQWKLIGTSFLKNAPKPVLNFSATHLKAKSNTVCDVSGSFTNPNMITVSGPTTYLHYL